MSVANYTLFNLTPAQYSTAAEQIRLEFLQQYNWTPLDHPYSANLDVPAFAPLSQSFFENCDISHRLHAAFERVRRARLDIQEARTLLRQAEEFLDRAMSEWEELLGLASRQQTHLANAILEVGTVNSIAGMSGLPDVVKYIPRSPTPIPVPDSTDVSHI